MLPVILATIGPILAKQGLDLLASVFKGAGQAGVEKITKMVKEQTGIDIEAKSELDETDVEKLRQFEAHNAALLAYYATLDLNNLKRAELEHQDRNSARAMQTAAMQSGDPVTRNFLFALSILLLSAAFGFLFYGAYFYAPGDGGSEKIADNTTLLFVSTIIPAVVFFWLGSSFGSKSKDQNNPPQELR